MRCINCGISLKRIKRHSLSTISEVLQARLRTWINNEYPLDSCVCNSCLFLLNNDLFDNKRQIGHPMVCLSCGTSVRVRHQRMKEIDKSHEFAPYLLTTETFQDTSKIYVCYPCWMRLQRNYLRDEALKNLEKIPEPSLTDLNPDPKPKAVEKPASPVLENLQEVCPELGPYNQRPEFKMNNTELCRCCLNKGEHKYRLDSIENIFSDFFNINLMKSSHSSICNACMISFKEALKFRNQVVEAEKKFVDLNVEYENDMTSSFDLKIDNLYSIKNDHNYEAENDMDIDSFIINLSDNGKPVSKISCGAGEKANKENGVTSICSAERPTHKKSILDILKKKKLENANLAPKQSQILTIDQINPKTPETVPEIENILICNDQVFDNTNYSMEELECEQQLECDQDYDQGNDQDFDCDQGNDQDFDRDQDFDCDQDDLIILENVDEEPICIESGEESDVIISDIVTSNDKITPKVDKRRKNYDEEDPEYCPKVSEHQKRRKPNLASKNKSHATKIRIKKIKLPKFTNLAPRQDDDLNYDKVKHNANLLIILENSNAVLFYDKTELGYSCGHCRDRFIDPEDLRSHVFQTHINERNQIVSVDFQSAINKFDITGLKCNLCQKLFDHLKPFKDHLVDTHGKMFYTDINDQIVEFKLKKEEVHDCTLCPATYESFKSLVFHMNVHYRNYECDSCEQAFILKKRFVEHQIFHSDPRFKCKFCDKTFRKFHYKNNHEKKWHLNIHTTDSTPFICKHCNARFKSVFAKNVHLIKDHNMGRKYQCKICPKSYYLKWLLDNHTRRVHLMEREVQCPYCDMKFFNKITLDNHLIKHNKDKILYECDLCGKKYVRKYALRVHLREHYDDKRFKCHVCGVRFVQKSGLQNHLKSKHDIIMIASEISPS